MLLKSFSIKIYALLAFFICAFLTACKVPDDIKKRSQLELWIQANKDILNKDINEYIREYDSQMARFDTTKKSGKVVFTIDAPYSLGDLAKKAGDSTECIAVILSFSENRNEKKEITIAAIDSSCFKKLKDISLPTDSTLDFIYGNKLEVLRQ